MKRIIATMLALSLVLAGCSSGTSQDTTEAQTTQTTAAPEETTAPVGPIAGTQIVLSDNGITVDGKPVSTDESAAVHIAHDIVYYEEGHDFTYGEGSEADAHSAEEAAAHTVVTITQPGVYALSGKLSAGQVAVDLGEGAEEDPSAVVTLVLNGVDITCTVAPAVIFYNVYECGTTDEGTPDVDTTAAGANVFIADGTTNTVNGSYVARIYEPDTVELSEDGSEIVDAGKLHKYDAAFYSKMSMNVDGNNGTLDITAENEGLDSELHLTINGGNINIHSGNDGINTNEDGISVTTINGGSLDIIVTGQTGEGDGIDSNGYLVINGGRVSAMACSNSADAGIDSDMGIYLNGGTVVAAGHMLDRIAGGDQTYAVFQFAETQTAGKNYQLESTTGNGSASLPLPNDFSVLLYTHSALVPGEYTLSCDGVLLSATSGLGGGMMPGGAMPEGEMQEDMVPLETSVPAETPGAAEPPEMPTGQMSGGMIPPEGQGVKPPEGIKEPDPNEPDFTLPEGENMPQGEAPMGMGGQPADRGRMAAMGESSTIFTIVEGGNYFANVTVSES